MRCRSDKRFCAVVRIEANDTVWPASPAIASSGLATGAVPSSLSLKNCSAAAVLSQPGFTTDLTKFRFC